MTGVTHTSVAEGTTCDDGNDCSTGDRCTDDPDNDSGTPPVSPRACAPTGGVICSNPNPCKSRQCVMDACPFPDLPDGTACSTQNRCIIGEACQDGECTGEARNCSDDNPCTTDSCEPDMSDPDADPVTGCKHVPTSTSTTCDDVNPCTEDDHCQGDGACEGTARECQALDECHGAGSCDPGSGDCTDPVLEDGTACESTGRCASGTCEGGTPTGTGGTGGRGAGGGATQGGEAGDTGAPGGDTGEAGDAGDTGSGGSNGGRGGSSGAGRGGSAAAGASGADGTLYKRDPGGCNCRIDGGPSRPSSYGSLALLAALALFGRRRRARSGDGNASIAENERPG
jgi:MYXO-CTERM domain-containing protein